MKTKYYFNPENDEESPCYTKKYWLDYMKENNLSEMKLTKAVMETKTDYFWCSMFHECGLVGESCGKECSKYSPRNGKNGRCKYSKNCYTGGDEITLKVKL